MSQRSADPSKREVWLTALITGLLTSTFSTLFIVFGSHRIGRDLSLSFMEVGTVLLRYSGVQMEPSWREVLAGVAVHQGADIFWALVFFGLAARWTWQLRPIQLLAIAPFWAAATSAAEYYAILPWLQPLLIMQTPYWIALGVHMASAAAYPLFYWVRKWVLPYYPPDYAGFGRRIGVVLAGVLVLLVSVEVLGGLRLEPYSPILGSEQARAFDQSFERSMTAHHVLGVELAQLAATKAERDELRMLGRLMIAEQQAEIESQKRWWSSWFGGELPPPTPEEQATMPGIPPPGTLEQLAALSGPAFERRFLDVMISHHEGAIEMTNEAWGRAADPRLRLFADQIRHPQIIQVERMQRLRRATSPQASGPEQR